MNKRILNLGLAYFLSCAGQKVIEEDKNVDGNSEIVQIYGGKGLEVERQDDSTLIKYNCEKLKVGLVGASNTVRAPYRADFDELLTEACPGSQFYLYAKGGKGPAGQKPLLEALLKDHPDLDYVVLDPSANEQDQEGDTYTKNVIALAEMVKKKDRGIELVVLTNTPFKGYKSWSEQFQQHLDDFNKKLVEERLGRSDLIDYAVDTYSATEDPAGSDYCGKFCVKDKIHFNTDGEAAVTKAVLDTVFRP